MSLCTTAHFLGMSQLDAPNCLIEMTLRTRDQLPSGSFGLIMFDGGTWCGIENVRPDGSASAATNTENPRPQFKQTSTSVS
jgi:hypothetical protein